MNYTDDLLRQGRVELESRSDTHVKSRIDNAISTTFAWMAGLLFISFGLAYTISTGIVPLPINGIAVMASWIGGLAIIWYISSRRQSMSYQTIVAALVAFAALEGYGLSGVFLAYGLGLVYQAFLSATIMFGLLAFAGYYLKVDIARVGPVLMVGLVALIIAMVANFFIASAAFDLRITIIGLVIFAGLVIYKMNVLKQEAMIDDERMPLVSAMGLFITFLNIFLFLLRLFSGGRN